MLVSLREVPAIYDLEAEGIGADDWQAEVDHLLPYLRNANYQWQTQRHICTCMI